MVRGARPLAPQSYVSTNLEGARFFVILLGAAILVLLGIAAFAEITGMHGSCLRVNRASSAIIQTSEGAIVRLAIRNYCSHDARIENVTLETPEGTMSILPGLTLEPGQQVILDLDAPHGITHANVTIVYNVDGVKMSNVENIG
ncbi:hypothetical protein Pyrfu_0804 [Pyrolobus fumarii 1A]|uniref:Uncharacterized protein n=1 Tax=Pyrolobus fumarii (strain DSM 11204 / 1A) TaxID=694429 RepID=G0EDI8_PYRF1|nr:hypothetical protein [Pyrolobus fumarii]AEM38673.1 hypothetical protein Pyrfu_0804 [Pyrolobus fumarii 1A]